MSENGVNRIFLLHPVHFIAKIHCGALAVLIELND